MIDCVLCSINLNNVKGLIVAGSGGQGAWSMGHGAGSTEHGAWSREHRAWSIGQGAGSME